MSESWEIVVQNDNGSERVEDFASSEDDAAVKWEAARERNRRLGLGWANVYVRVVGERDPEKLTILVSRDDLDGGYIAEVDELPGCLTQGETIEETLTNLGDAIRGVLEARAANSQAGSEA